ncbi:MAG TPA: HNH endonuclease [Candidatus Acidoferrum sp.]|nr:HNH endonuclease [Candidatus Acidoferrum sp.]
MTETLAQRFKAMLWVEPDLNRKYYAITVLGSELAVEWSCISHWEGFTKDDPPREIRAASLVNAKNVAQTWRDIGQPYVVVNSLDDMVVFMLLAGNALIERAVAEETISEFLAAHPVAQVGVFGFRHIESLPKGALNRAPTPRHRMRILKRDDFRCRVCGRRSTDHVDVELHVHHIRPWAQGGVTEDSNLITLCHTCHKGLEPHFEWKLFDLASWGGKAFDLKHKQQQYKEGVAYYRRRMLEEHRRRRGAPGSGDGRNVF